MRGKLMSKRVNYEAQCICSRSPNFNPFADKYLTSLSFMVLRSCVRNLTYQVAVVACLVSAPATAADVNGYISLTTDYVYRGVTRSDEGPAGQLGIDVSFNSGLYVGVWASTVDIGNSVTSQRDREVNYYAGYGIQLAERWRAGASLVAYRFPGAFGLLDYDHEEYSASLNYDDRVWFEYSYAPDYYNTDTRAHHYELFGEWPLPAEISLSAAVGHFDAADFSGRAYTHWQLGVSRPVGRIDLDIRYHDTSRWVPRISNPERAAARVSLTARFQF